MWKTREGGPSPLEKVGISMVASRPHADRKYYKKEVGMEFRRLDTEWETLVAHMRSVGYSDFYVWEMELTLRRLFEDAPSLRGWDEVRGWAARWSSEGKRPYMWTHLEIARQFDEDGVLPRTPESVRHRRACARRAVRGARRRARRV